MSVRVLARIAWRVLGRSASIGRDLRILRMILRTMRMSMPDAGTTPAVRTRPIPRRARSRYRREVVEYPVPTATEVPVPLPGTRAVHASASLGPGQVDTGRHGAQRPACVRLTPGCADSEDYGERLPRRGTVARAVTDVVLRATEARPARRWHGRPAGIGLIIEQGRGTPRRGERRRPRPRRLR